jgi:hypothetical protein
MSNCHYQIALIGDNQLSKSLFIQQINRVATISNNLAVRDVFIDNSRIRLFISDPIDHNGNGSSLENYHGAFIILRATGKHDEENSLQLISHFGSQCQKNFPVTLLVAGGQYPTNQFVDRTYDDFCRKYGIRNWFSILSKTGEQIDNPLKCMAESCHKGQCFNILAQITS